MIYKTQKTKINYFTLDTLGVCNSESIQFSKIAKGAFSHVDDVNDLNNGTALVAWIDNGSLGIHSVDWYRDRIGSEFRIKTTTTNFYNFRFTLRNFHLNESDQVAYLVFWTESTEEVIPLGVGSSPFGTIFEEDFWKFTTRIPDLDSNGRNFSRIKLADNSEEDLILPAMGSVAASRWVPIISDVSTTIGSDLPITGGIAPSDGFSITLVKDKAYEEKWRFFLKIFDREITEPKLEENSIAYVEGVQTQENPEIAGDEISFIRKITNERSKAVIKKIIEPYNCLVVDLSDPLDPVLNGDLPDQPATFSRCFNPDGTSNSCEKSIYANPIPHWIEFFRTRIDLGNSERQFWINGEMVKLKGSKVNERTIGTETTWDYPIHRGLLNSQIKTHKSNSTFFNYAPFSTGLTLRFFEELSEIKQIKRFDGFSLIGISGSVSSDENLTSFSISVETDLYSVFAKFNEGLKLENVRTIPTKIVTNWVGTRSTEQRATGTINAIRRDSSYNGLTKHLGWGIDTTYDSDEVASRYSTEYVDVNDLMVNELAREEFNERMNYFWGWVYARGCAFRLQKDLKHFSIFKLEPFGTSNENVRDVKEPDRMIVHWPPIPYTNLNVTKQLEDAPLIFYPIPFARYDGNFAEWFWNELNSPINFVIVDDLEFGKEGYFPAHVNLSPNENERVIASRTKMTCRGYAAYDPSIENVQATADQYLSFINSMGESQVEVCHVFEPNFSNPNIRNLRNSNFHTDDIYLTKGLIQQNVVGNSGIAVSVIEVILQILTSTGNGNNSFPGFNFDTLPVGLGFGINSEAIDLDSFLNFVLDDDEGEKYLVRNLVIKASEIKDRKQFLEKLLKSYYLVLTTSRNGKIKLTSSVQNQVTRDGNGAPKTIYKENLRNVEGSSYKQMNNLEEVSESLILITKNYLANYNELASNSSRTAYINSRFAPFPSAKSNHTTIVSNEEPTDTDLPSVDALVYDPVLDADSVRLFGNQSNSTKFERINSVPTEVVIELNPYVRGDLNSTESINNPWLINAAAFSFFYRKPNQIFEFTVVSDLGLEIGDVCRINLPNFSSILGRDNSGNVIGIVKRVQQDFKTSTDLVQIIILDSIEQFSTLRNKWSASADVVNFSGTTIEVSEKNYMVDQREFSIGTERNQPEPVKDGLGIYEKDIDGFKVGDVIKIYDSRFMEVASTTITYIDRTLNQITTLDNVSALIDVGYTIMLQNRSTQLTETQSYFAWVNLISSKFS